MEEFVSDEVRQLMREPVLRRLADRLARNADPVLVRRLWRGVNDPIPWFAERMEWYWRLRCYRPRDWFELEDGRAPARAVIAVYKDKRGLLEASLPTNGREDMHEQA